MSKTFTALLFMTSLAHADDDADRVVRWSFACNADSAAIRSAACSLDPRGSSHTFSIRVGDETCGGRSAPDAIVLVIHVGRRDGGAQEVVVEAQSPDDASSGDVSAVVERTTRALESMLRAPGVETQAKGPWYGWQIILGTIAIDAAGTAGVIGVDAATNGKTAPIVFAAVVAVSARVLIGPVIHLLQHEPGNAARSLGVELGLPVATALTLLGLSAIATNGRMDYPQNALALGAAPGAFIATIVDASAFSTKHVATKRCAASLKWAVFPVVGPTHAGLGVAAAF